MKRQTLWIVDGHNLIFKVRHLTTLQVSGERGAARRGLEDALRAFAARRGERVLVVYDGNASERNPDAVHEELLRTVYTWSRAGEADDRIVFEARSWREHGFRVRVVTSDLRLVPDLPEGVSHLEAGEFWRKRVAAGRAAPRKTVAGDFSDVEAEFLRADAEAGAAARAPAPPGPAAPPPPGRPRAAPSAEPRKKAASPPPEPPVDEGAAERAHRRKEKGRRRQERRLARYRKRR